MRDTSSWTKVLKIFVTFILTYATFILYSAPSPERLYTVLMMGGLASLIVALFVADILVTKDPAKIFDVRRWCWALAYALRYFTIEEFKAHYDVIKRILHPKMPIRPGIVRVPYNLETDHGIVAVANSVTNTPGTVIVDLKTGSKHYYIHWIDVVSRDEKVCFDEIMRGLEKYSRKIFD